MPDLDLFDMEVLQGSSALGLLNELIEGTAMEDLRFYLCYEFFPGAGFYRLAVDAAGESAGAGSTGPEGLDILTKIDIFIPNLLLGKEGQVEFRITTTKAILCRGNFNLSVKAPKIIIEVISLF